MNCTRTMANTPFRNACAAPAILGLVMALAPLGITRAVTLSDNLSATSAGAGSVTSDTWLANSFKTDASSHVVSSVTLLLKESTAGSATLSIFSDDGLDEPGALFAVLTS